MVKKNIETKRENLSDLLAGLRKVADVQGFAIVSRDGLMVAADLSKGVDEETFAAMSAAMYGAADTAMSELKRGQLKEILARAIDMFRGTVEECSPMTSFDGDGSK